MTAMLAREVAEAQRKALVQPLGVWSATVEHDVTAAALALMVGASIGDYNGTWTGPALPVCGHVMHFTETAR